MEQNHNKKPAGTRTLTVALAAVLLAAILVLVFSMGMLVGQKRAEFSFRWAENYHRNFAGPSRGFFGNFPAMGFMNSHGIFGPIISITGNTIIVKGEDTVEETAMISDKTTIINKDGAIKASDLKVGDSIVIIGSPNAQGQIDAKLIRLLPAETAPMMYLPNHYHAFF
jgi:hypothetical protein